MKHSKKVLIVIFCISAVLMYMSSSIRIVSFDGGMYKNFFKAKNTYSVLPDADERASSLLGYLGGNQELNSTFFNEREILHMKDVKHLFSLSFAVLLLSMITCAAIVVYGFFRKEPKLIASCLLWGGAASLGFAVLLALLSINFPAFFDYFHKLLFSNDLWLMDASVDKIVALLPESFFRMAVKRIFLTFGVLSFGMLMAGILVKWMAKRI